MSIVKELTSKLADLEKGIPPEPNIDLQTIIEVFIPDAMDAVRAAGKADPQGVWEVLRNGTEDEFSALCNCLPEIGGEFESDASHREVMRIAKQRLAKAQNYENLMAGIRGGFGQSFDKFWNETPPVAKAKTFNQAMQGE